MIRQLGMSILMLGALALSSGCAAVEARLCQPGPDYAACVNAKLEAVARASATAAEVRNEWKRVEEVKPVEPESSE